MRIPTVLIIAFACAALTSLPPASAASLPRLGESASGTGLVEQVASQSTTKHVHKHRRSSHAARKYGPPYYVPYFCSQPYQYRYWQSYPPICYPLNRPLPQYKR